MTATAWKHPVIKKHYGGWELVPAWLADQVASVGKDLVAGATEEEYIVGQGVEQLVPGTGAPWMKRGRPANVARRRVQFSPMDHPITSTAQGAAMPLPATAVIQAWKCQSPRKKVPQNPGTGNICCLTRRLTSS